MTTSLRFDRASRQSSFVRAGGLTLDDIAKNAPSVMAVEAHHSRGERYAFIPTIDVVKGLQQEGFRPFEVRQTRTRIADRHDFTKHMVRLRHVDARGNGQEVPEVVLINSHDGTSSYQLISGIFRMVCSNGLIAGENIQQQKVRHSGNVVNDVIEGAFRVIDESKLLLDNVEEMKAIQLDMQERCILASAAQQLRWEAGTAPVASACLLQMRRPEDMGNDLWTTFNRVQENLLQGGLSGRSTTNRRTTTRAVQGVNENVKLNRALWTLAEGMAALKNGRPVEELPPA